MKLNKHLFSVLVIFMLAGSSVAHAQGYTIEVFAGNPIYGQPYYQKAIERFNYYWDYQGKDAVKLRSVNMGGKFGVQVSSDDGKLKVGFDYHWNNYKTNFAYLPKFNADTQLKFKYTYFGATIARRLFKINLPKKESKLPFYYVMGLHFGTQTCGYRIKGSSEWLKQNPGAVVYDKSGLILWDNGLQAEIPVYKFLSIYPKVGYQMNIAGEGGVAGLPNYLSPIAYENKRLLNRGYIEVLAAIRINDLIK